MDASSVNAPPPVLLISGRLYRVVAIAFLAGFAALGLDLGQRKSATWDEGGHIAAGYSYWRYGDYRVATFNLFLAQKFLAAPLVLLSPRFPEKDDSASPRDPTNLGFQMLYKMGNDHAAILRSSRAVITGLGVALGAVVLFCSTRLFGRVGGLLALLAFVCCPPLLAHSALATTDIAAALLLFLATMAWWRLLHRGDIGSILLSGVAIGALLLTKYSAAAFVGIAAVLMVVRVWIGHSPASRSAIGGAPQSATRARLIWKLAPAALTSGLVAWLCVWAFFGFTRNPGGFSHDWSTLTPGTLSHQAVTLLRGLHLFPDPFVYDLTGLRTLHVPRPGFLAGHYAPGGQAWFFPAQFVLKTPLVLLAVLTGAAVILWRQRRCRSDGDSALVPGPLAYRLAPFLALITVYSALLITGNLNLGIRHLLPVYPPLCVLAGGLVLALAGLRRRLAAGVLALCGAGFGASAASAHPDPLSWFNSLAGGPSQGYTWFLDSSTDWGEELPALARWLDDPKNAVLIRPPVFLAYFGTALPSAYGVRATQIDSYFHDPSFHLSRLRAGTFCVSPSTLQGGNSTVFGPWSRAYEEEYRALLTSADSATEATLDPQQRVRLHQLFSARLCALLRQRSADARVRHSFFIYRLTGSEVELALRGPPAELIDGLPHTLPRAR